MSIQFRLSVLALAVAASTSILAPTQAYSQTRATNNSYSDATISSFGVEPLRVLRPGEELKFALRATPGAKATLQIEGASAPVTMTETRPGQFEGSYIIRQRDQLTERTRVTVNVVRNGRTVSAMLAGSLQAGSPDVLAGSTNAISDFQVIAPKRLRPGEEVIFAVKGLPGGQAHVAIDGIGRPVPLREVSRGSYEGIYVVRRGDQLRGGMTADAYLINNGRESTRRYQTGDQTNGNAVSAQDQRRGQLLTCVTCGTVESVKLVEAQGQDSKNIIGTIAGGLLGGVLGNQVGNGSGQDAARIIGAIGGAYVGNRAQNTMSKDQIHRVTVRLQDGSTRDFDYAEDPQVVVGTLVKVEGDLLVRQ
jgi:outer membrane lipoprotein SlyB